jgi:TM2 domain-containing membrane protein YozV
MTAATLVPGRCRHHLDAVASGRRKGGAMTRGLDTERLMRYDADKKSTFIAYLLWFFLGLFGLHRFYLGRFMSGFLMLVLHGLSWLTWYILIGFLGFGLLGLWWLIDALLIPGMVRRYNHALIDRLGG